MQKIKTSFKSQSFRYNFAVDGGAISSIVTPVVIPAGALMLSMFPSLQIITPLAGGAGALFAIETPVEVYYDPQLLATYNSGFATTNAAFINPTLGGTVQMTISVNTITAGEFIMTLSYWEYVL